jgi:two-component system, sensor histidine kinase
LRILHIILFIFLLGIPLSSTANSNDLIHDLSKNSNATIPLKVEFEFYWNQFFTTNNNGFYKTHNKFKLDSKWISYKDTSGVNYSCFGYATYRCRLILPQHLKNDFSVLMPPAVCNYKLYVDGVLILQDGKVGITKATSEPHYATKYSRPLSVGDTIEMVLQVSNFHHSRPGMSSDIYIGTPTAIASSFSANTLQDSFIFGCLIMATLFFFGLYLLSKKDTSILLYACFTLIYAYRAIGTNFYVLHNVFPNLNFFISLGLEYLTMPTIMIIYANYLQYLFPRQIHKIIKNTFIVISIIFCLAILVLDVYWFTRLLLPYMVVMMSSLAYAIYVFYKAYKAGENGAKIGLISFVFLSTTIVVALFEVFNIYVFSSYVEVFSFLIFFALQAVVILQRFAYILNRAKVQVEQALDKKAAFLRTMSHEVRTPLNGVIGITDLLKQDDSNLNKQQKEYVDTLKFSSNNLLNIVNDILDLEKLTENKFVFEQIPISITEIVQKVSVIYQQQAKNKNILLTIEIDERIPKKVLGDPTRLWQVLNNLLSNAIKFTNNGKVHCSALLQTAHDKINTIAFKIEDTGIGIPKEQLSKIFEPFVQADSSTNRSFGGTGLGLAICHQILTQQNAALKVESEINKGTTFSFELSFLAANVQHQSNNYSEQKSFVNRNILIVEDNQINALVAQKTLERWQIKSKIAYSGSEALNKVAQEDFDMVLMDLQMPEMDGYETAKIIRTNNKQIPIVALTANLVEEVAYEVLNAGMNESISKPFKPTELHTVLSKYL